MCESHGTLDWQMPPSTADDFESKDDVIVFDPEIIEELMGEYPEMFQSHVEK